MRTRKLFFLLFWISYYVIDLYLEYLAYSDEVPLRLRLYQAATGVGFSMIPKMLLGWVLLQILITKELPKKIHPVFTTLLISAVVLVVLLFYRALFYYFVSPVLFHRTLRAGFINLSALNITFFDMIGPVTVLIILEYYHISQKAKERAMLFEKEKIISELKFLKSQINPHFLFNTLNNIYALARKQAPQTPDVVMRLSKLLRFMLYESGKKTISISEEIKVLEDYTELERIRHGHKLALVFHKAIDDPGLQIAPLILLPFIENAFKHGAGESRHNAFINIQLLVNKGELSFTVENSNEATGQEAVPQKGIGLQNVQRQLALLYPTHQLTITHTSGTFAIILQLKLM